MKDYYYAYDKKEENGVVYLKVPVIVSPETEMVGEQYPRKVYICRHQFYCIFVWIPETYYDMHKRDLENQAKADERSCRCLVPDPVNIGGRIRCPEENRCAHCSMAEKYNFDCGRDVSLEKLMESGYDAGSENESEKDFELPADMDSPEDILMCQESKRMLDEMLDSLIALFNRTDPKVGAILNQLRQGATNASEIARRCGLNPKHASEEVRKAQKKAKLAYSKMKK